MVVHDTMWTPWRNIDALPLGGTVLGEVERDYRLTLEYVNHICIFIVGWQCNTVFASIYNALLIYLNY